MNTTQTMLINYRISAFFVLILVTFSVQADIDGLVVRVLDGDTIEVVHDNGEKSRIRLTGIDAPEKKQPFVQRSRQSLSELVSQKHVYITGHEFDRYNRLLGTVWSGRTDINAAQIHRGMAWAYRFKGQISNSEYGILENESKTNRTGLWSASSQTEPWIWRKNQK
ncbi:chromosome partitioning protein ParB, partial [Salmonella enterica]|nr:chromosome partitioning protein ParB [Salmonella enterica]EAX0802209.1 chromosome partitioning protein ParB [Salmonella enterica]